MNIGSVFPFFKKTVTGEKLTYDQVMLLNKSLYAKINDLLDKIPDDFKHDALSGSFDNYVETLENIYMSRYSWYSPYMSETVLDNIEKFLMKYKKCAIVREKTLVNRIPVYSDHFGVYNFSVNRFSPDGETPLQITIRDKWYYTTDSVYTFPEFIIIKDFSSWKSFTGRKSVASIIADYANRLSLVDAVINANLNKHRLPVLVGGDVEQNNKAKNYFKELFRGALWVFNGGSVANQLQLEAPQIEFIIDKLQQHKDLLMQEFCAMIGINNSQNYTEVYQNKDMIKANSSFVFNVAQSHYINRKKLLNRRLANFLELQLVQNKDIYGQVDLVTEDNQETDEDL